MHLFRMSTIKTSTGPKNNKICILETQQFWQSGLISNSNKQMKDGVGDKELICPVKKFLLHYTGQHWDPFLSSWAAVGGLGVMLHCSKNST